MNDQPLDIAGFLKLVIEALEAAGVEYLIGGAGYSGSGSRH